MYGIELDKIAKYRHMRPVTTVANRQYFILKGQFNRKSKIYMFPLTCSAMYPSRLFRGELQCF